MGESERGRPTGTVSFLFTDVEGSTVTWEQRPAAMRDALARHDRILRSAIDRFGGCVFSTAGDAFSAAFWSPLDAVVAALDAQRALQREPWPNGAELRVRMGVHTGTAHERDGDYFGSAVNRAARLMGLAHGGQVLVSLVVEELVRDDLPNGSSLTSRGEHRLRGLSRPEHVFELGGLGLARGFPTLRSDRGGAGNLPSPPTSFVGRVEELKRLVALLSDRRLVTLVGPGGAGKTRLSIEAAAAMRDEFPDGVWFVDLAPLSGPEAVLPAVAVVLSAQSDSARSVLDAIVESLAGRRTLIVLDNCEHVVGAVAPLAAALVSRTGRACVLATSREALGIGGEQLWPVAPLDAIEAAELFDERARSADPSFTLNDAERQQVIDLCGHLDGMPLAVELAAARARSHSIADLMARIGDRFTLLRTARRRDGVHERHQTLLATVEWSYQLLDPDEQTLFDRLSVFAGSFDTAAVEAICSDDRVSPEEVVDLLDALVDRSMVQIVRGDALRLRLLETLRQFGADRLSARGETDQLRERHRAQYVSVSGRARDLFEGTGCAAGRALFEAEWDNLRAAVDHADTIGDEASGNQLVRNTFWFGWLDACEEQRSWTRRRLEALARPDPGVLACAAAWANLGGDLESQDRLGRRAVAAAHGPDHPAAAHGWWNRCASAWYGGRRADALRFDEAAKRAAARGPMDLGNAFILGWTQPRASVDPAEAQALLERARALAAPLHNNALDAIFSTLAGHAAWANGDRREAIADWRRSAALAADAGLRNVEASARGFLATRAPAAGEPDTVELFRTTLERLRELNLVSYQMWALVGLADWWAAEGRLEDAGRILGFLDRHDPGGNQSVADLRAHAADLVDANAEAAAWRADGAACARDDLIRHCLDSLRNQT